MKEKWRIVILGKRRAQDYQNIKELVTKIKR